MAADMTGIADKQLRRLVEGLVADGWKVRRGRHGVLVLCPCSSTDGRSPHGFTVGGTVNDKGRRRANIEAAARRCAAARDTDQRQTCYTYLAGGNRRKESPP